MAFVVSVNVIKTLIHYYPALKNLMVPLLRKLACKGSTDQLATDQRAVVAVKPLAPSLVFSL